MLSLCVTNLKNPCGWSCSPRKDPIPMLSRSHRHPSRVWARALARVQSRPEVTSKYFSPYITCYSCLPGNRGVIKNRRCRIETGEVKAIRCRVVEMTHTPHKPFPFAHQGCIPCPGSCAARVAISYLDKWQKHSLRHSSPFVPSWHLGEPLKGSAIQESPTSNIF